MFNAFKMDATDGVIFVKYKLEKAYGRNIELKSVFILIYNYKSFSVHDSKPPTVHL